MVGAVQLAGRRHPHGAVARSAGARRRASGHAAGLGSGLRYV
jgi:hypothetical protein